MATPFNPDFYPDAVAAGSLAAALQAVASENGPSFPVVASEARPLERAMVPSTVPHRSDLAIDAYVWKRHWNISGGAAIEGGMGLIGGDTDDLAEIAKAARAWHDGASLAEIRAGAPFVHLTGRFEVADGDPVQLTASEWQHMRTRASEADWPEYQALIEAAYAEPALRALYPFTSHWTLRFSTSTRPHLTTLPPCLSAPQGGGQYTVTAHFMGEVIAHADAANEAVATFMHHMPDSLGPVTLGAAPRDDRAGG